MPPTRLWFVRAGRDAVHFDSFRTESFVAIGWGELGKLPADLDEELDARFAAAYPAEKERTRSVWANHFRRFVREMEVGDAVVTYDPTERLYLLGTIVGGVEERQGAMRYMRRVRWSHRVPREPLSVAARNSLGAIATLFKPSPEANAELWAKAVPLGTAITAEITNPATKAPPDEAESEEEFRQEQVKKAEQFIEDRIARLDWEEMQELLAGILRGMGYRTRVSAPGPDRGVDIFASPDGLGLQEPRIFCEVKHRLGETIGAPLIRSFLGGRKNGDRLLYLSTGGFTKEAKFEAERASVPLRLLTLPDLRELLVEHYENLDAETRALVPLKKVYWPAD